ncbi:hemerythrin domain-containing protein [Niveispirillum sp.]|uniref:hemerythrin domain-containing protein n=1 Tax=Niveispirillum sp. TaxID=1917217 RepID=UPI001B4D8576|nr:hemerythrin domain-containing protein [Niveispirillum sp.]MBP7335635.1 hemerythrin domain-containing protein [Niveispirillum sp.]
MSRIVPQLKHDHAELKAILEPVRQHGIGTQEGRRTLLAARTLFIDHIRREDEEFYPDYRRLARQDPLRAATADQFSHEMVALGAQILGFFDKYREGGSGMEFALDFGRMSALLQSRWHKEEAILYARYEELAARKAA